MLRHLVEWYQCSERQSHKKASRPTEEVSSESAAPPSGQKGTTNPCEILIRCTSVIPKLVEEGKADAIVDTLRAYNQLPYVDKEALVRNLHKLMLF